MSWTACNGKICIVYTVEVFFAIVNKKLLTSLKLIQHLEMFNNIDEIKWGVSIFLEKYVSTAQNFLLYDHVLDLKLHFVLFACKWLSNARKLSALYTVEHFEVGCRLHINTTLWTLGMGMLLSFALLTKRPLYDLIKGIYRTQQRILYRIFWRVNIEWLAR